MSGERGVAGASRRNDVDVWTVDLSRSYTRNKLRGAGEKKELVLPLSPYRSL